MMTSLFSVCRVSALVTMASLLAAGCSSAAPAAEDDATTAEALSTCGPKPPPIACNVVRCTSDGWDFFPTAKGSTCTTVHGAGTCDGDGTCSSDVPITGTLYPHYYLATVMYAPPGTQSTVDYGVGSTMGSTTTTSASWTNGTTVTVTNKEDFLGFASGGLSLSTTVTEGGGSSSIVDLKTTVQSDQLIDGFQDAINHDLDKIYLWLNPQIDIVDYGKDVSMTVKARTGQDPDIQFVYVQWLRDPTTMPSNIAAMLASAQITPNDYPHILAADPFVSGTAIDPNRFVYQTEFPYEPVAVKGQNPVPTKFAITKSVTNTNTSTCSLGVSVKVDASGGVGFFGMLKAKLSVSDTFTWTHSNQYSKSSVATTSASANIMQPAFGYTGPVRLNVYLDTVFNTYLFAFN